MHYLSNRIECFYFKEYRSIFRPSVNEKCRKFSTIFIIGIIKTMCNFLRMPFQVFILFLSVTLCVSQRPSNPLPLYFVGEVEKHILV